MKPTKQVELTKNEQKIFDEFIDLLNLPTMDSDLDEGQKKVIASLGVGVYRQAQQEVVERVESLRRTERFPQSLTTFDGKTKTFNRLSDSDISYNKALDDVLVALQQEQV